MLENVKDKLKSESKQQQQSGSNNKNNDNDNDIDVPNDSNNKQQNNKSSKKKNKSGCDYTYYNEKSPNDILDVPYALIILHHLSLFNHQMKHICTNGTKCQYLLNMYHNSTNDFTHRRHLYCKTSFYN